MEKAKSVKKINREQKNIIFAYICIAPAILGIGLVVLLPIIKAIGMSFFEYSLVTTKSPAWNWFGNYKTFFEDGDLWTYLWNTCVYMFAVVGIQFCLAMGLALLLNRKMKGRGLIRAVMMLPWVIPSIVTSMIFSWLLNPQFGVLNYLMYKGGISDNINQLWVQDPNRAMLSVIIASVWKGTPYMMLMLLAGLQSLDTELKEAAAIDGANRRQNFFYITLPSIKPVIESTLVVSVISASQAFTVIYNMTGGGPMDSTMTLSLAAYNKAFIEYDLGAGAALGVIWLVILMAGLGIYQFISARREKA